MSGADLYHWVALRRISDSQVTKVGQRWLDRDHPVPDYLTNALTELSELGLVTLIDVQSGSRLRAELTKAGTARFEHLCQIALGISAAQFMTLYRGSGMDEPDH